MVFAFAALLAAAGWLLIDFVSQSAKLAAMKGPVIQNLSGPIKTALLAYAADHQGQFPDAPEIAGNLGPQTSNVAFRRLFEGGYLQNEKVFMVKQGAAQADGDMSASGKILARGENHWALAKGLRSTSDPSFPLVWEAPLSGSWDPTWDSSLDRNEWGSTWRDGSVYIMTVGGSVAPQRIAAAGSDPSEKGPGRLVPTRERKNQFQLHPDGDGLGPEW